MRVHRLFITTNCCLLFHIDDLVPNKEAVGGVVSAICRVAGSDVPTVVGSPLVGAGVVNTGSPCGLVPASSVGLSGSSTVAIVWSLVVGCIQLNIHKDGARKYIL